MCLSPDVLKNSSLQSHHEKQRHGHSTYVLYTIQDGKFKMDCMSPPSHARGGLYSTIKSITIRAADKNRRSLVPARNKQGTRTEFRPQHGLPCHHQYAAMTELPLSSRLVSVDSIGRIARQDPGSVPVVPAKPCRCQSREANKSMASLYIPTV